MPKLAALLKKVGFSQKHIDLITADDAETNTEFVVDTVANEVTANIHQAVQNDDAFMGTVRTSIIGEVLGAKERHILRASGGLLTQAELDALPKAERFNKVVDLLVEKVKADAGKTDGDKDKEIGTLRGTIQELEGKVKNYAEVELPKALSKADEVEDRFHIRAAVRGLATKDGRKTVLDEDRTVDLIMSDLTTAYDLKRDRDKNETRLNQRGKDLLAYSDSDKSKPLSLDEAVEAVAAKGKYFVQNNGDAGDKGDKGGAGSGTRVKEQGDGGSKTRYALPGMAAAEAAVAKK